MDTAALVISIIAVIIAGVGAFLTDRRSKQALQESRKAVTTALWSAVQEAVQRLLGFDPTTGPIDERLANLRIAMIDLADEYTEWDGLDTWLDAERLLGAATGRQVMEAAKRDDNMQQRLTNLDPLISWAGALSQNLRLFRRTGYDKDALAKLRVAALDNIKDIHERHGWDMPRTSNPRLRPLK
ncbi:hypothetical protein [Clavibacter nebraskensis]|uniref:Uncharacterized protein n=2 Tax=Clavibacter nebraskensis TaxID=31963 RepID=A0AAI8ZJI6_9MICO|nr:hypothetical protein [Clavibacter nebraskensis]KXU20092.1 hypothetical protein VV38_10525 [Clavibacter nebraskensis]OAH19608.1 hypothetical protein A3Q38_08050 [Clavibacter nebraskensis]QGV67291.1 hypothetical protein EGX36_10900 [Clavibacter nebraskensis]QGV70087.1 hypothetical protein EGX37_10855 [Clavibacter nebraskensis]QGV72878.1 hypothetical protein EGX35_10855 [Clavibacter nebraskensis]